MPTQLTAPIPQNETQAVIDTWGISITRNGALSVDLPNTSFGVTLTLRRADGSISRTLQLSQNGSQLTPAALTAIRTFQNSIVTYLRSQGLLPAGVDTSDF